MSQKLSNREIIEELEVGDDRIWTLRDWKCDNCNEPETRVGKLVLACDPTGVKKYYCHTCITDLKIHI